MTSTPAACRTISDFLEDTNTSPEDYDLILTGDLGAVGTELLCELMIKQENIDISSVHNDCGLMIYDTLKRRDVGAGGSGCGCSAITLCGELLNKLNDGKLKRILFCGPGALLSPTSTQQGLPIPGVCHAVSIITGRD